MINQFNHIYKDSNYFLCSVNIRIYSILKYLCSINMFIHNNKFYFYEMLAKQKILNTNRIIIRS